MFLAELYAPTGGDVAPVARVRAAVTTIARRRSGLRYRLAIVVPEDDTCFYLFDAPSARAVAAIGDLAGIEFARIVEVADLIETREGAPVASGGERA